MKKTELNAMLDVLDEYSTASGINSELGYEYAMMVAEGVRAIKRVMKSVGVPSNIIRDRCDISYARGVAKAKSMKG